MVTDKLGSAVSRAASLNAEIASLLGDKARLTTEEVAALATIGANAATRVRDLRAFPTASMRGSHS